jgi:putative transposase
MPRSARIAPGGEVYHVINRAAARHRILKSDADFLAFERILAEAMAKFPTRILSYCLMGNHWHFIVWPREDGELTAFFRWLTHTHSMRWRVAHNSVGYGPVYQGRFKSFLIEKADALETVCRYVERNALSADLVKRVEDWRWGSLWARTNGTAEQKALLSAWPSGPGRRPIRALDDAKELAVWTKLVNEPMTPREVERIRLSLDRSRPFGSDAWTASTANRLGLEHTLRNEGRPRKVKTAKPDTADPGQRRTVGSPPAAGVVAVDGGGAFVSSRRQRSAR